jgi:GT2 family glycosyltransferase
MTSQLSRRFVVSMILHESAGTVGAALDSVVQILGPKDAVVVVDNGSSDGSAALAREHAPEAVIIEQGNVGFGRANNVAFRIFECEFFALVNPDVEIIACDLERVVLYFREHPKVVAVVGDVRNADGSRQYVNRRFPTWDVLVLRRAPAGILARLRYLSNRLIRFEMRDADFTSPFRVPCGTGSFMIIRTAALRGEDPFDPRFFLYFEDVDLARRLYGRGETHYLPWLVVKHRWGKHSHRSLRMGLLHLGSAMKYLVKWGAFSPPGERGALGTESSTSRGAQPPHG